MLFSWLMIAARWCGLVFAVSRWIAWRLVNECARARRLKRCVGTLVNLWINLSGKHTRCFAFFVTDDCCSMMPPGGLIFAVSRWIICMSRFHFSHELSASGIYHLVNNHFQLINPNNLIATGMHGHRKQETTINGQNASKIYRREKHIQTIQIPMAGIIPTTRKKSNTQNPNLEVLAKYSVEIGVHSLSLSFSLVEFSRCFALFVLCEHSTPHWALHHKSRG